MSEPVAKTYTMVVDLDEAGHVALRMLMLNGMGASEIISEALVELQKLEEMVEFIADEDGHGEEEDYEWRV